MFRMPAARRSAKTLLVCAVVVAVAVTLSSCSSAAPGQDQSTVTLASPTVPSRVTQVTDPATEAPETASGGTSPTPAPATTALRTRTSLPATPPKPAPLPPVKVTPTSAPSSSGKTPPTGPLKAKLLRLSDLPAGWLAVPVNGADKSPASACEKRLDSVPDGRYGAAAGFTSDTGLLFAEQLLSEYSSPAEAKRTFAALTKTIQECGSELLPAEGENVPAGMRRLAFPSVGNQSTALTVQATLSGMPVGVDVVIFRAGNSVSALIFGGLGTPDVDALARLAKVAAARAAK